MMKIFRTSAAGIRCTSVVSLLALALAGGCSSNSSEFNSMNSEDQASQLPQPQDSSDLTDPARDLLEFENAETAQQYHCEFDRLSALARQMEINSYATAVSSNGDVVKSWCGGINSVDNNQCFQGLPNAVFEPGSTAFLLNTYVNGEYPSVDGINLDQTVVPVEFSGKWRFNFSRLKDYTGSSGTLREERFTFAFVDVDSNFQTRIKVDSLDHVYEFLDHRIGYSVPTTASEEFALLTSSPESFQNTLVTRIGALKDMVTQQLSSNTITDCNIGSCEQVTLNPAVAAAQLTIAETKLEEQLTLVNQHANELHQLIIKYVQPDVCAY